MALWSFLDYRTDDEPPKNPIQLWYGRQDREVQADFDVTVAVLAATEDWKKTKTFKLLTRKHAGLAELRFSVRTKNHGKETIRRFRPLGLWREEVREFVFLAGCEKSRGAYTPKDVFEKALEYKAKLEHGKGEVCEHY